MKRSTEREEMSLDFSIRLNLRFGLFSSQIANDFCHFVDYNRKLGMVFLYNNMYGQYDCTDCHDYLFITK